VAALGSVTELVSADPGWVSSTAWPPLAELLLMMLAPAGSVICSACTVAMVVVPRVDLEEAARLVEANGPAHRAKTPTTIVNFKRSNAPLPVALHGRQR
jgi:hypothetical protein